MDNIFKTALAYSAVPSKNVVSANINILDTSIKHQISGKSTTVVKGCMYIMFKMVDTAFIYIVSMSLI